MNRKETEKLKSYIDTYGDLLFDLCQSLLLNSGHAQLAFRSIIKKLRSSARFNRYVVYERSWILKIGAEQLLSLLKQQSLAVSPEQQIELDAKKQVMGDLESFDFYFSRLRSDSQLLLLLKDKHHLPYADIADALGIPVDSLKLQRQQALRTLEEWLWTSH